MARAPSPAKAEQALLAGACGENIPHRERQVAPPLIQAVKNSSNLNAYVTSKEAELTKFVMVSLCLKWCPLATPTAF